MTHQKAKALRNRILATGLHCTVPLGYGPKGYFARIFTNKGGELVPLDFKTYTAWEKYKKARDAKGMPRPRSPMEAMIDRACGITEAQYK